MEERAVLTDGIYQVWSRSKNMNKGVFHLTITGMEVGEYASLAEAERDIRAHQQHKRMVAIHTLLETHKGTPEEMAWLRGCITGFEDSGHRDPLTKEK